MSAIAYPHEVINCLTARYPEKIEQAGGNPQFAAWLFDVDRHLSRRLGVGHRDMPDRCWADEYEAGTTAREAALDAISYWHDEGDLF